MNKPQNRKDKIQLLKDLQSGKVSIEEIIPKTIMTWRCVDGIYTSFLEKETIRLTVPEFKEYISKRPKQKNIIFKTQEGNEPIDG